MVLSKILCAWIYILVRMQATYIWYLRFSKPCIDRRSMYLLLKWLSTKDQTERNLGILPFDCSVLYSSELDKVAVMESITDYFIESTTKSSPFHSSSFYFSFFFACRAIQGIQWDFNRIPFLLPLLLFKEDVSPVRFLSIRQTVVS